MNNYPSREKEYRQKYDAVRNVGELRQIRNARARAWNQAHKEHVRARANARNAEFKKKVYDHYGMVCVCCGITEEAFLTIDHINKNGKEHREQVGNGAAFYKWIVDFGYPTDLRILCMNCNYGERRRPQCPHKLDKSANG